MLDHPLATIENLRVEFQTKDGPVVGVGDVSFVTPFRYSRMIFALVVGVTVFDETPDVPMLLGTTIIVASGLYTVWRERQHMVAA